MKKSELKQIIKEELKKVLTENPKSLTESSEFLKSALEQAGFEVYPCQAWIIRDEKNANDYISFTESGDYRCIRLDENLPGAIVGEDVEDFVEQFVEENS